MSYLVLNNVAKRFRNHGVVEDFSLAINEGEFVSLVGPSGSGKTTILRMIAGLVRPDAGKISLNGVDLTFTPASRRGIGLVFQAYALFPHMTSWDNIAYPLRLRRKSKTLIKEKVGELIQLIGIHDPYQLPGQLSGGEQQRVALARAMAMEPRLILLDEPFSALDAKVKITIRSEFRRLHDQLGTTMIMVTHDQEEAFSMADRVGVLSANGRLEQFATPEEVYYQPASLYVSSFIGASNAFILDAVDRGSATGIWRGQTVPLAMDSLHTNAEGRYVLFIRPECVVLTEDEAAIPVVVVNKYFFGATVRIVLGLDGQEVIADVPFPQGRKMAIGDSVRFRLFPVI